MRKTLCLGFLVVLLLLSGCTSVPRVHRQALNTVVVATSGQEMLKLAIPKAELEQAGYVLGDWVDLEIAGLQLRVQITARPLPDRYSLVPEEKNSVLYGPLALSTGQEVVLTPSSGAPPSAVGINLSGNFLFSF